MSASLVVLHFLIGLSCLTRDGFSKCMNEGMWGLKMLFVGLLFCLSFFIKNHTFIVYSRWALYLSSIYLFVQMVSIIDAMYLWAEFWAKKFDDGNTCYGCLLIFVTLLMYTGTGFILYYSYKLFWISGCFWNMATLIIMTVFVVLFTVLILLKFHPKGSLITSGSISLYGVFLAWTAFISYPNNKDKSATQCNPVVSERWSMLLQLGTSLLVAFICTFYWSISGGSSSTMKESGVDQLVNDEGDDADQEECETERSEDKPAKNERLLDTVEEGDKNDYSAYEDNSYLKFHMFMLLYSIYLCPLFTNWGNTNYSDKKGWDYGDSDKSAPFAIKLTITFMSMLLYLWTIIAPQVLTTREFDN